MPVRRLQFAALLVLVIGCAAPPREPPPGATTVSNASIVPDAAAPQDAAPERPPPDAGPPPATRYGRVINARLDGDGTRITIDKGIDDGFHDGDRGELYDANRATVSGSDFVLEGCKARTCRAVVDLPLDTAMEAEGARLP
jgi:hypothetical protein